MAKYPGLFLRDKTFYIRVRVPKTLLEFYKPDVEIKKSLKTKNFSDAVLKYKTEMASILADFEFKRKSVKEGTSPTDMLSTLSNETLESFARDWCEMAWQKALKDHGATKKTYSPSEREDIRDTLFMEVALAKDEVLNIANPYNGSSQWSGSIIADEILKAKGISYNKNAKHYDLFRFICSRAHLEYTVRHLNFWDGVKHSPTSPMFAKSKSYVGQAVPMVSGQPTAKPITIAKLYEEHINNPSSEKSESTKKNYIIPMRVLMHIVGEDRLAHEVTREDCKKVREILMGLPANYKKKLGDIDILDAVKKGKDKGLELATVGTLNGWLQKMSAVFEYGIVEGYLQSNPARKLQVQDKESAKDKRHPFSAKALNTIFSSGVYAEPDISIYKKCANLKKDPKSDAIRYSYFWVPLIALFSGMRLNEICQLNVSDVQVKNGIPFINVSTQPDDSDEGEAVAMKKVKTAQSIRIVPVHPMLRNIGFLEYVETVKQSGTTQLFPDIKEATTGYMSGNFSKYFTRYLKDIGVKTKKTSFHSFRHNFRDAEREAEMPEHISQQLGGWTTGKTDANYGSGVKIETLSKWMDKIAYPEVDLSHLY